MPSSICDTDLIVKISKESYIQKFFENYSVVNFADAVIQEIERKSAYQSTQKMFSDAMNNIQSYIKTDLACIIDFSDLDNQTKRILRKEFVKHNIIYHENIGKFQIESDLGEKVCVIYADLLDIELILSDDRKCLDLIRRKPRLKINRLRDVLEKLDIDNIDTELVRLNSNDIDGLDSDLGDLESKGSFKSFANLGEILKYKQKMS